MIDWTLVTGFEWDAGNARKSQLKHDVSQTEAETVFFNDPLLVLSDVKHSQKEARFHALGMTDESRMLHVTFTLRKNQQLIRIISARDMHEKEKAIYEQIQEDP